MHLNANIFCSKLLKVASTLVDQTSCLQVTYKIMTNNDFLKSVQPQDRRRISNGRCPSHARKESSSHSIKSPTASTPEVRVVSGPIHLLG